MRPFPRWLRWSGWLLLFSAVLGAGAFLYGQSLEDADRYASVGSLAVGVAGLVLTVVAMIRNRRPPDPPSGTAVPPIQTITVHDSTVINRPRARVYLNSTRYYDSGRDREPPSDTATASGPKRGGRLVAFFRRWWADAMWRRT